MLSHRNISHHNSQALSPDLSSTLSLDLPAPLPTSPPPSVTICRASEAAREVADKVLQANDLGQAPAISNTGATTRQSPLTPLPYAQRETGGIDTLLLRCKGTWKDGPATFQLLESLRLPAEEAGLEGIPIKIPGTEETAWLRTFGHRVPHEGLYKWVLEYEGITISVAQRTIETTAPNVLVRLGSIPCMAYGGKGAWRLACEVLEKFGFKPYYSKASELHLCVDLLRSVAEFVEAYIAGRLVSKAVEEQLHGKRRKKTGITLGTRTSVRCNIYGKLEELENGGVEAQRKRELLRLYRGVADDAEFCTRIEFQLSRDQLRTTYQVDTVEDVFERLPHICDHLTVCWLRLLEDVPDRENRNQSREKESEIWAEVREAFKAWAGKERALPLERIRDGVDAEKLMMQAQGVILSAMARNHRAAADLAVFLRDQARMLEEFGESYVEELRAIYSHETKQDKLTRRRARIRARIGSYESSLDPPFLIRQGQQ